MNFCLLLSRGPGMTFQPLLNSNDYNCNICWNLNKALQHWVFQNLPSSWKLSLNQMQKTNKKYLFINIWCRLINMICKSLRNQWNNELYDPVLPKHNPLTPLVSMDLKLQLSGEKIMVGIYWIPECLFTKGQSKV